jgi:enoyl-[acyl-carrier protein] reductase II
MQFSNRITQLFNIQYPIIQAGMVWASGWRLASAVSNAGALGLIGSGSMYPEVLREHIQKCKAATDKPFGVNIPLLYAHTEKNIQVVLEEEVKIVFTSAGNPKTWTSVFKEKNITVVHVVSSSKFALKAQEADCDAVVAEGFEAGGHNGREETTTLILVPAVVNAINIPVIAAGGIATGRQMFSAMVLGAEGVQMGSRFVCTTEASSHINFKEAVVRAEEGSTMLSLKKVMPVRILKNHFFKEVNLAEQIGATEEELKQLLGRGRARRGMFLGELEEGELEIGQSSVLIKDILPAASVVENTWKDFLETLQHPL